MSDHKRQHYVPKCHLRRFSADPSGRAVNLFNAKSGSVVQNASIKGQCAKNYLYGEDLKLESALQKLETEYGNVVDCLARNDFASARSHLSWLKIFAYIQFARTDMATRRLRMMEEDLNEAKYEGTTLEPEELDLTDRTLVLKSLQLYMRHHHQIEDLRISVGVNRTDIDFITSDDPSIFTSRYCFQRLKQIRFGLSSSGATFFLPISPRLVFICYDSSVYHIGCEDYYFDVKRKIDVDALNELQYIKCAENIYFQNWADKDRIAKEFQIYSKQRPSSWHDITVLVLDEKTMLGERYRRATDEERLTEKEKMLTISQVHPRPTKWLSPLKIRSKPRTYSNGSAAGHVRKSIWLHERFQDGL